MWANAEPFTRPCDEEDQNGVLIVDFTTEAEYGKNNIVVLAFISRDGKPAGICGPVKLAVLECSGEAS